MRALVAHPGGFGDVLLAGPAVRALATRAGTVTMLCAARGAPAARLLPHVDDVLVLDTSDAPDSSGPSATAPADSADSADILLRRLRRETYDVALVLVPERSHPWPAARLPRSARIRHVTIGRSDGPYGGPRGSLRPAPDDGPAEGARPVLPDAPLACLARPDAEPHRTTPPPVRPQTRAALRAVAELGFGLRAGDDGRLRVRPVLDTAPLTGNGPYVVVHPGAGDPARVWDAVRAAGIVARLCDAGHRVVVTGGPKDAALTRAVSGDTAVDLGARTTPRAFAGVLHCADLLVTASSGPAHLAAAVGTPVVGPAEQLPVRYAHL
ncbi:glycosyltransferase family 9 protein [Streptomyces sp. JW3]|uniref:glycosyltransferase family 9 protein n=1 Tax=Streptomyces sp. JW3 TaxID=3456955 RepID=UPI003FA42C3C